MSSDSTPNLPKFYRVPEATAAEASLNPGSIILTTDTDTLYIDSDDHRVSLSPVRSISSADQLASAPSSYVYITPDGDLHVHSGSEWVTYQPAETTSGEATYLYRFEITERVAEVRFTADMLGVTHTPEFDILDADNYNISGSDWLKRRWEDDEYVVTCSGDWPVGVYYLKLSYNVKNDSTGSYISDTTSTQATITVFGGQHYSFTQPLTSLTINISSGSYGQSTLLFTTASTFSATLPDTVKFIGSVPTFDINTTYYITLQGSVMSVSVVAGQ